MKSYIPKYTTSKKKKKKRREGKGEGNGQGKAAIMITKKQLETFKSVIIVFQSHFSIVVPKCVQAMVFSSLK